MKKKFFLTLWALTLTLLISHSHAQQDPAPFTLQTARNLGIDQAKATSYSGVPYTLHNAKGDVVVLTDPKNTYGMRYELPGSDFNEIVDTVGNRTRVTRSGIMPIELKHEFLDHPIWYERAALDSNGNVIVTSVDHGNSLVAARAAQLGMQVGFPDWLQVTFPGAKTICQIRVFTLQDNFSSAGRPALAGEAGGPTKFSLYGITDYEVQYQNAAGGWITVPGGYITNNRDVGRALSFSPISTKSIRLFIKAGLQNYSRVVELEALELSSGRNVALASLGSKASASSTYSASFPAGAVIDGDETGVAWAAGGGWADGTSDTPLPVASHQQLPPDGNNYVQDIFANAFLKVTRTNNLTQAPTAAPLLGYSFLKTKERVEFAGKMFEAGLYITNRGTEIWDSAGGSLVESYDYNHKIFYIQDGQGPIVRINRDQQGRPTDVFLGSDIGLLQFVYDSQGWLATFLSNRVTGLAKYAIARRDNHPATNYLEVVPHTTVYLPEYGPIVEWSDAVSTVGNIVSSINGHPYAYIPLQQAGTVMPVRRAIAPFADETTGPVNILVEYDSNRIRLHLPTGTEGVFVAQPHEAIFNFDRALFPLAGKPGNRRPAHEAFARFMDAAFHPREVYAALFPFSVDGTAPDEDDDDDLCPDDDCYDGGGETINVTTHLPDPDPDPLPPLPPPPPPPPDPPPAPNDPCTVMGVDVCGLKGSLKPGTPVYQKAATARKNAANAMENDKCAAFVRSPWDALRDAGFNGTLDPSITAGYTSWASFWPTWWNRENYIQDEGRAGTNAGGPATRPCTVAGTSAWTGLHDTTIDLCLRLVNDGTGGGGLYGTEDEWWAAVLIHEFLHTLGMPEGDGTAKPTSSEITNAVKGQCGSAIHDAAGGPN